MQEFSLSNEYAIPQEHLLNTCKYRQNGCCKYIVFFQQPANFFCVKKVEELKQKIDTSNMNAKGDNCEGLPR